MIEAFEQFIESEKLFSKRQKVLIGVSGGIDSVVLCHLFKKGGYNFGIAHCNFLLRGEESDGDAEFVKQLADELEVDYFERTYDTNLYSKRRKQSIQVVARELRYEFFEKTRKANKYDRIATAHHMNDNVETVIYNLTKGCGIRGLHGIMPRRDRIVRPILFASKKEILDFAKENSIDYREDSSNALDKYARNKIRHNIIPTLKEINPVVDKTFAMNIQRFRETEEVFDWAVSYWKRRLFKSAKGGYQVDTHMFEKVPNLKTILYEILKIFDFNAHQLEDMLEVKESGRQFMSTTHRLLVDRQYWYITELEQPEFEELIVPEFQEWIDLPDGSRVKMWHVKSRDDIVFGHNIYEAFFDVNKIKFPLTFRRWQKGDTFQPFGMEGHTKKVSAYFRDEKMSVFGKDRVWIMESKNRIAWICGRRSDNRFRITSYSKGVLICKFFPKE